MSRREWGALCPEGHGVLHQRDEWVRAGVQWCPHEEHGGNGRFYRNTEVQEGNYDPDAPRVKSEWQLEQDARMSRAQQSRQEFKMEQEAKVKPAAEKPRPPKAKAGRECKCGCKEMTKGGLFRPGHDARYHSRIAKEQAEAAVAKE